MTENSDDLWAESEKGVSCLMSGIIHSWNNYLEMK